MRWLLLTAVGVLALGGVGAAEEAGGGAIGVAPDEVPAHLVKVLRTTNKAQTNRYIPKVYEFKHVNPFDVVRFYRRVTEIEEGRFATFVAPDGKSGLLLVIAPEYQIPYLDELMRTLDRPGLTTSSGEKRSYVPLQHRAADDVGLLRAIWGQSNHTASRPAHGTRAPDNTVLCDLETGSIYLQGAASLVERAEAVIAELDKPLPQVLVETTVYEIDLNNDGAIGFDYYSWMNGPGRNLFAQGLFAEYGEVDRLKGGVNVYDPGLGNTFGLPHHRFRNHGYNTAYFLDVSTAYLDFLVTKGVAGVVTSGRVVSKIPSNYKDGLNAYGQSRFDPATDTPALAGSPAEFRAHDEVLYYRVETVPTNRGSARPAGFMVDPYGENVDYEDNRTLVARLVPLEAEGTQVGHRSIDAVQVGTHLEVTPRIAVEHILLELELEVSSLLGFDGVGEPRISARRAVADVRVEDNEVLVFGGLERARRVQSVNKFPLLGSIPVLGWILGNEKSGVKKTVVVAVVKASRVTGRPPTDTAKLIDEVEGNAPTATPKGRFGFDQWLLDK